MNILIINSGSSSIKYELFQMPKEKSICGGAIEGIGEGGNKIKDHLSGLEAILGNVRQVQAVGHRVVHGGEKFKRSVLINQRAISDIRGCAKLAPLHNPANLQGIIALRKLLDKRIPQVAVFDTAFFTDLPESAYVYALPYEFYRKSGIRRYGFHGTSHEYVANAAAGILKQPLKRLNLITCHLGNGCSISAVKAGRAVDTSMGFTPLEGLVMGTRCGDIDPAIIAYLIRKYGWDIDRVEAILNKKSGLKGISGLSNDMRRLKKAAKKGNHRARLAIDIFTYRVKKYIGGYLAVLGRCDAVIFTGGIGEHQSSIRSKICAGLFVNLKNKPRVLVIPTREELMIAKKAYALIKKHSN